MFLERLLGAERGCSAPAGGRQGQMASPILSSEAGWGPPLAFPRDAVPDPKDRVRTGGFKGVCSTAPAPEGTVSPGLLGVQRPSVCRGQLPPQALWRRKDG